MKNLLILSTAIILTAGAVFAVTIYVPGNYPTIQAGINAAVNGDTVLVADGTYTGTGNKNISFGGRQIVVISENGPENCIINCENNGRGFYFNNSETSASILSGFRIINGSADQGGGIRCGYTPSNPTIINCIILNCSTTSNWGYGGGINCEDSNPTLINCTIAGNSASSPGNWAYGGGIYLEDADPTISNCTISGNIALGSWAHGAGIYCDGSNPTIDHCAIYDNSGSGTWSYGAGICCRYSSNPTIVNCTINANSVFGNWQHGGGIHCSDSNPTIVNTIVEGNLAGEGVYFDNASNTSVSYGDFYNNSGGNFAGGLPAGLGSIVTTNANGDPCDRYCNILLDPLFVDPFNNDFHLQANSPCIDAGDPTSPPDPDWTVADMGAYYYDQGIVPLITITLTPQNPPIQIPAGGGSFLYDITIENNDVMNVTFDGWTMAVLPNGSVYGPLILRSGLSLAPGGSIIREDMEQLVPGNAPAGAYYYLGYIGVYPDNIVDSDSIYFEKLPGYDADNHDYGWSLFGWDGENAPVVSTAGEFMLCAPYPNPFNPTTAISYQLQAASFVKLAIYDIQGREVVKLVDDYRPAGTYEAVFNASNLSGGVYFARLTAGNYQQTQKLLLVK